MIFFCPGTRLPESVTATGHYQEAVRGAEIVVSVMPSHHCRRVFEEMWVYLTPEMLIVSATKGLENNTHLRMSEVITQVIKAAQGFTPRVGALSGPSFAKEVARGDPTAITIASPDDGLAEAVQREFSDPQFRVYTNSDVIGVELGGALKNTIAIAAGVCDGLGLGHNSIAALITRGLAEMTRLVVACGGQPETMAGLAGLGDLVLTCTGRFVAQSQRRRGARPRRQIARHHCRHAWHGGRRRVHDPRRSRTGAGPRGGDADHRADGRDSEPREAAARSDSRTDDPEWEAGNGVGQGSGGLKPRLSRLSTADSDILSVAGFLSCQTAGNM